MITPETSHAPGGHEERALPGSPLLVARQVSVRVKDSGRVLVDRVSLAVAAGSCLGIVGESGSGKTLLCRALLALLPRGLAASGQVLFEGQDVLAMTDRERRSLRGRDTSLVTQQAMTAFGPLLTLGTQMAAFFCDRLGLGKRAAHDLVRTVLERVNLPPRVAQCYPHELSGGMLQRCMTATSLGLGSRLVVADEPTTALDAKSRRDVLLALKGLVTEQGTALILVSHDLGAVQTMADTILVLQGGRCVEYGCARTVLNAPRHEYTRYLVRTRKALSARFARFARHGGE